MIFRIPVKLQVRLNCQAVPPRCRKPRTYYHIVEKIGHVLHTDETPQPAYSFRQYDGKKVTHLWLENDLYVLREETPEEHIKNLQAYARQDQHHHYGEILPEDADLWDPDCDGRLKKILHYSTDILLTKDAVYEKTTEAAYTIHRSLSSDSLSIDTHPTWGHHGTYRLDQYAAARAAVEGGDRSYAEKAAKIFLPHVLRGKINPGELVLNPEGEEAEALTKKLHEYFLFHKCFTNGEDHIYLELFQPTILDGKWNIQAVYSRENTLEATLFKKETHQFQTIARIEARYEHSANWRDCKRLLFQIVKEGNPPVTENLWTLREIQEKQAKEPPDPSNYPLIGQPENVDLPAEEQIEALT